VTDESGEQFTQHVAAPLGDTNEIRHQGLPALNDWTAQ
jgi:hypothetical protein